MGLFALFGQLEIMIGNLDMPKISASDYRELMTPWLKAFPQFLRRSEFNPALQHYGTGESDHWAVQSNCNVFAAMAVMGEYETALSLLRYALKTHRTGRDVCSNGTPWGCHWISVLGPERMTHGLNLIREYLTEEDLEDLCRFTLAEADWLLEEYPVVAGISPPENKPESNIWNGGFLLRAAMDYPDAPNAARYREKATSFLVNGISHPLDAACETVYNGKTVREWYVGYNFTPGYSLDHHGYLNVGYMVICLSNIAMLHFNFKERGQTAPPELYHHVRELWDLVKKLTFHDGRLLRIGGDTRARYTYCQNFAIPMWIMAADLFNDPDAIEFERKWLKIVKAEADYSGDGGFYSRRLGNIRQSSYYYYARLESDVILCLSYGAYWRKKFAIPDQAPDMPVNPEFVWEDRFHGANLRREGEAIRSWVWRAAQGGTGLCVPADHSDMGEWQRNLCGELKTVSVGSPDLGSKEYQSFEGGFLTSGQTVWTEKVPLGEGEGKHPYAKQQTVAAALPDGKTMLILDYAVITKEITLRQIRGLSLKMPNDLFNKSQRRYRGEGFDEILAGNPGKDDTRKIGSSWLVIDEALAVRNVYGADGLTIYRPEAPSIIIKKESQPWLHSLYADEICSIFNPEIKRYLPKTVVLDCGAAVSVGNAVGEARQLELPGLQRGVEYTADDGSKYVLIADFGLAQVPQFKGELVAKIANGALYKI